MRFTIERLRTMVLVAAVLLVIALGIFLGTAKFRNRFNRKDLPQKLGLNIQEQGKDVIFSHSVRGQMLYKIRASKQVQLKQGDKTLLQLHDVAIELYGEDGSRVDRIAGDEFDYDPDKGVASAKGPVEITLMKPTTAPAIAPKATASQALNAKQKNSSLGNAAQAASNGEIHVKTSGLIFDRDSGVATTDQRVDFTLNQGSGSAMGAKYDSHEGTLVLDRQVDLTVQRGPQPVKIYAQHAMFQHDDETCDLTSATMRYRDDESRAEWAKVFFREDGSAEHIDAAQGFSLVTAKGGRLAAPTATLAFDEHNQPVRGHLQGGVTIDSDNNGRKVHGTAPTMDVVFAAQGELKSAHLERGVQMVSDDVTQSGNVPLRTERTWASPVLDIAFRDAGKSHTEPASMHGTGGVVITGSSQRGDGPLSPSKMTADDVVGEFGPNSTLRMLTGHGHAAIVQTTANGTLQTTRGDVLVAYMARPENANAGQNGSGGGLQVESATVDGNVVLTQQPPAKDGTPQPELQAKAGHAEYDSDGEWLRLTRNPRVNDGAMELTADKVNMSQVSGDAFALGNVKASWQGSPDRGAGDPAKKPAGRANALPEFGGQGPSHVVAEQAQLGRSGMATFKGNARLWQQGNSVTAPVIVLDRTKQTLAAQATSEKTPVQVVMVSAGSAEPGRQRESKRSGPSVIRVRGGDLKYSDAERKGVMLAGLANGVQTNTADATITSNEEEVFLLPPGNHAGKDGGASEVDRMISTGRVEISSGGRRGWGEKLVYSGDTGDYVLTGTSAALPRVKDPVQGTVTGAALIFSSRDDSVKVEGDGRKTTTVTTAPKK